MALEKAQVMVARGLMSLAAMEDSAFQTTSVCPFYFVGLGCTCWSDREALLREINRLAIAQRLGYIRVLRALLRQKWQQYDQDGVES
ncbi:hypothetical protein N7519_009196 [Penicillium mononematosum]|uniref:uncharacterized protein n=1 Tax=Penicillium mononematosum TaxID=268346 RepID=UPI002546ED44|nr:uncharacterized protein N7519_009196 [Penicillium mononematosum]KAJ6178735.1 hypothetical protein N7519_009196 [Penicillium mononematosum]